MVTRTIWVAIALCVTSTSCGNDHSSSARPGTPTGTPAATERASTPTPTPIAAHDTNVASAVASVVVPGDVSRSAILRSIDGGVTWSSTFDSANLAGVTFADPLHGWAVGVGDIFNADDGGVSWHSQRAGIPREVFGRGDGILDSFFLDAAFLDHFRGVVVGGGPAHFIRLGGPSQILVTADGGVTWVLATISGTNVALANSPLRSVCFTAQGIGVASGGGVSGSVVVLSADGGHTWSEISDRACAGHVACAGDRSLWIVGGETICHSDDGGISWTDQSANVTPPVQDLRDIVFLDERNGWAVGLGTIPGVVVVHTTNGGERWDAQTLPLVPGASFMTPQAIAFASATDGVIVGSQSNIQGLLGPMSLATFDAGATWSVGTFPANVFTLSDVAVVFDKGQAQQGR